MHAYPERTTIRRPRGLAAMGLILGLACFVLTSCSNSAPSEPGDQLQPDSLAAILSAEMERLEARSSNADSELAAAEEDWTLYQQGWDGYQAAHPEANDSLLRCAPLRFVGEARIIGPEGGTIELGTHRLVIPAGALTENVVITGELTAGPLVAVDLLPHGLTFEQPVLLQVAYNHCGGTEASRQDDDDGDDEGDDDGGDEGDPGTRVHEIVHVGLDESILEQIPSTEDPSGAAVNAWLGHFSRYALMY